MKTFRACFFIIAVLTVYQTFSQVPNFENQLISILDSKDDGKTIIENSKNFWNDIFEKEQLPFVDSLINFTYTDKKYNLNLCYLFAGLSLQLNSDVLDYLNFLQHLKVELKPENIDTPAKVAGVISSLLKDKDRSEFIKAILTLQISIMWNKE